MHFPCTHTPSTIRRPLAASTWNAIPGRRARGTEGGEQQWKRVGAEGEDKVPRVEAAERHGRDKGGVLGERRRRDRKREG